MEERKVGQKYEIRACGCKCWYCPRCCVRLGLDLRRRLIAVLATFKGLLMWTLTIDPKLFVSPMAAYEYVRAKRCVSELVRVLRKTGVLHSGRYFYVVEWQQQTEMPHFHLLVDAEFIDFDLVREAWNRFRPQAAGPFIGERPGFGAVRFSAPKFADETHAARYACKYLTKHPSYGYPEWVLTRKGQTHRFGTSRGFWPKGGEATSPIDKSKAKGPKADKPHPRDCFCPECRGEGSEKNRRQTSIQDRLAKCGLKAVVTKRVEDIDERGEIHEKLRFVCEVPIPFPQIREQLGYEDRGQRSIPAPEELVKHLEDRRKDGPMWRVNREAR